MCFLHAQKAPSGLVTGSGAQVARYYGLDSPEPPHPPVLSPFCPGLLLPHQEEVLPSPDKPSLVDSSLPCRAGRTQPKPVLSWSPGESLCPQACTWPGTERKQGHCHGSRALGQRRRSRGVIKVLTDKNCPLGHSVARGLLIEEEGTENISF